MSLVTLKYDRNVCHYKNSIFIGCRKFEKSPAAAWGTPSSKSIDLSTDQVAFDYLYVFRLDSCIH
jgi:hypothetical protein